MKYIKAQKQGIEIEYKVFGNKAYIFSNLSYIKDSFIKLMAKKGSRVQEIKDSNWVMIRIPDKDKPEGEQFDLTESENIKAEEEIANFLVNNLETGGFEVVELK